MPNDTKAMRVDNSGGSGADGGQQRGRHCAAAALPNAPVEMLPLHLPFGFELPVEQAHLFADADRARGPAARGAALFREWIIRAAKAP